MNTARAHYEHTHYRWTKVLIACAVIVVCMPLTHAQAISIAARVSDQSTEVMGGDRMYFEVEVKYPENTRRKDLRIEYQMVEDGEVIARERVLRAVETQMSFLDYMVVPKSAKGGMHELMVIVEDYEDLHEEVSASFKVNKGADQVTVYFFILLGAILLVSTLLFFQIRSLKTMRKS